MRCKTKNAVSSGPGRISMQCELDAGHDKQHRALVGDGVMLWPMLESPTPVDQMYGIVLRNMDWMVAIAALDNGPESPVSLRSDLLRLVELARAR